ncbi:hypothetical protein ACS0TY_034984 [Phlomoides rotata]
MRSRWLAQRFGYQFQNDNKKRVSAFMHDVIKEVRVDVTPWQAYICKQQSIKTHEGEALVQY